MPGSTAGKMPAATVNTYPLRAGRGELGHARLGFIFVDPGTVLPNVSPSPGMHRAGSTGKISGFILDPSSGQRCNRSVFRAEKNFGNTTFGRFSTQRRLGRSIAGLLALLNFLAVMAQPKTLNSRRPKNEADLRFWLENMVWYHRFRIQEIVAATGLSDDEITAALVRFEIGTNNKPKRPADAPLLVLPYPGGRHPRIGFLDGAVNPQRETKVSVFTPWDEQSYVVVDLPEAIWSNLGLTYLAHTHVPTLWTGQKIELERLEWNHRADGSLAFERKLPNGIVFGATVVPAAHAVHMELWLTNGTRETLRDLRVQNCVMLKAAKGFEQQTNDNKLFSSPYVAC